MFRHDRWKGDIFIWLGGDLVEGLAFRAAKLEEALLHSVFTRGGELLLLWGRGVMLGKGSSEHEVSRRKPGNERVVVAVNGAMGR